MKKYYWIVFIIIALLCLICLGHYVYHRLEWKKYALKEICFRSNEIRSYNGTLRFITYNICYGCGGEFPDPKPYDSKEMFRRLNQCSALIANYDPDFVILNEVDFCRTGSDEVNQAEYIARRTKFPYLVEQRNIDCRAVFYSFQQGNVLLSRYPIIETKLIEFPGYSWAEEMLGGKSNGFIARIKLPDESTILLCVVHLESRSNAVRIESVRIIESVRKSYSDPFFLIGDLNCSPSTWPGENGDGAFDVLAEGDGYNLGNKSFPLIDDFTIVVGNPVKVVDWILPPCCWQVVEQRRLDLMISDHYPVYLECKAPDMHK